MSTNSASQPILNVFVLMLENRSFDHLLGFSGITGTDAVTGQPTKIDGLNGTESNSFNGATYQVSQPADFIMSVDPGHEFADVVEQLAGPGATYSPEGAYPPINDSGFVASYVAHGGQSNPAEIMKCYSTSSQLPVLAALAQEFAVCDNWYASMPGPTWPNRFFAHAASSGGLDHSPSTAQIIGWELGIPSGFSFENGTIFDRLRNTLPFGWRIYRGGEFAIVTALKGIVLTDTLPYGQFAHDVSRPSYPWSFTFIEPNYGDVVNNTYAGGTSQHPLDDVTNGEALIKSTYEAIRNSPHWNTSLLIVTWDEHGGFYDHATPPSAVAPGDDITTSGNVNQHGFTFEQCGPRIPAVVASAYTPRNVIDHRLYDHASIPATVEAIFGLPSLTQRDARANNLTPLVSLPGARTDAPPTLPNPAESGISSGARAAVLASAATSPHDSIDHGNLPGFLHLALRSDLALSSPAQRSEILARVEGIRTRGDARQYLAEVRQKIRAADAERTSAASGKSGE